MQQQRVGIIVYDGVEVLDFCGPYEVFSVTRLDEASRRTSPGPFDVRLVSTREGTVTATGGLRVLPDVTLQACGPLDLLVVPGGLGSRTEMHNDALLQFVREQQGVVASVCTGALVLGRAGLLDGLSSTTHWRALDLLAQVAPRTRVDPHAHVVDQGRILTSAGISAGIDLALRLVARFHGDAVARATAHHMEYPFPDGNARRAGPTHDVEYRADLAGLPWETPMPGVRSRQCTLGDMRAREVEWTREMPVHWCQRGHAGFIVEGELEVEFDRGIRVFRRGDALVIPDGAAHRHRARTLTDTVKALLVEKA